jgi:hypothetical protein
MLHSIVLAPQARLRLITQVSILKREVWSRIYNRALFICPNLFLRRFLWSHVKNSSNHVRLRSTSRVQKKSKILNAKVGKLLTRKQFKMRLYKGVCIKKYPCERRVHIREIFTLGVRYLYWKDFLKRDVWLCGFFTRQSKIQNNVLCLDTVFYLQIYYRLCTTFSVLNYDILPLIPFTISYYIFVGVLHNVFWTTHGYLF